MKKFLTEILKGALIGFCILSILFIALWTAFIAIKIGVIIISAIFLVCIVIGYPLVKKFNKWNKLL